MTAMDTLHDKSAKLDQMPRFDDGMINLSELIRCMAESLINEIMDAQAEDACAVECQHLFRQFLDAKRSDSIASSCLCPCCVRSYSIVLAESFGETACVRISHRFRNLRNSQAAIKKHLCSFFHATFP